MQHQNAPKDTFATEYLAKSASGIAQIPTESHIDADVEAIRELQERIEHMWGTWRRHPAKTFSARLDLPGAPPIPGRCAKCCKEVLLTIGTGALLR